MYIFVLLYINIAILLIFYTNYSIYIPSKTIDISIFI
jgi:hypothetical protein